jgi:hypothetical protein
MSRKQWNERLERAREFWNEGKLVWYRREQFYVAEHRHRVPKWHIFADRKANEDQAGNYIWTAKCGYQKSFSEVYLEEYPKLNLSKKPPKVDEQCTYCLKQLEKEQSDKPS